MAAKFSILAFRPKTPTNGVVWAAQDRRPTEAELAFVRARARQAARAMFEAEQQRGSVAPPDEAPSCE